MGTYFVGHLRVGIGNSIPLRVVVVPVLRTGERVGGGITFCCLAIAYFYLCLGSGDISALEHDESRGDDAFTDRLVAELHRVFGCRARERNRRGGAITRVGIPPVDEKRVNNSAGRSVHEMHIGVCRSSG